GGAHLARLAVSPDYQGQGIAAALVADAVSYFERSHADRLTVNTQQDNYASLAVYKRLGFAPTGEMFGAWQMSLI
ncbi:MAG: GNAT family N-acetyltransferase, partial [Chloroflexi bacterium]|nr:GNAT family N-acetyltransferase [Chloroflexota bacterium]